MSAGGSYGYYDEQYQRYFVVGPDGQPRAATPREAELIKVSGGSATIPAAGSATGGTPGSYGYYDESDGQYYVTTATGNRRANPQEAASIYANGGSINWAATPPAAPPNNAPLPHDETGLPPVPGPGQGNNPPAPPPPDWRTQQSWWGSLFPTEVTQRAAYDLDPSFAWATATNKLGGNNWAPEYSWMASQQGRMHTLYGDENTRNAGTPEGNMTFSDWIEKNAPGFHQQFLQQPSSQKGYNDLWMPQGRSTV